MPIKKAKYMANSAVNSGKIVFRRIGRRIVPILQKHPVGSGAAIVIGSIAGASAIRRSASQAIRGKGKTGTGNQFATALTDVALSYGILKGVSKIGGAPVNRAIGSFASMFKRSLF